MSRFEILLGIAAIALIGWLQLIYKFRRVDGKEKYAAEYLNKFRKYIESQGRDNDLYGWMTYESVKMQRQLGILGIMSNYKPPGANYMYRSYQVLVNILPELHRTLNSDLLSISTLVSDYVQILQEMFIRYLGVLNDEKNEIRSEIRNPLKAFRSGIQFVLLVPVYIVNWFGLTSDGLLLRISRNVMFNLFSRIVSIIEFASAVVGLVVGWEEFITIIKSILGR